MYNYNYTKDNIYNMDILIDIIKNDIGYCEVQYENETSQLNIYFNIELTTDQEILLETIITDYNETTISPISTISSIDTLNVINTNINTIIYNVVSFGIYNHNLHLNNNEILKKIQILSSINNGSYNIRAYDITNNIILDELVGLNNTNSELHTLTLNVATIFTNDCIIEIDCLVSDNTNTCNVYGCFLIYEKVIN